MLSHKINVCVRLVRRFFPYTVCVTLLFVLALSPSARADDPRAREIMTKVDSRDDGDNRISDMEMILIDKKGKKRVRKLKSFSKDKGEDTMGLMFFLHPADVKDTAFLTYDYDDGAKDDDQWLFLPALRKTKRIASGDKTGSFMGSDFSYADMTGRELENYDFTLLKESKVGDHEVWLIQSVPRNKEVIDRFGYTKSVSFVRKDNYVVIRAVNWVKVGKKLKYLDVKKLDLIEKIWVPIEIHMTTKRNKKTLHKTIMKFDNIRFNQNLEQNLFTVRQMEKGVP